jgi:tetratricopeptide (TPR) repeat protein
MSTAKRELIIQEADKLAARGKLDAAIKEYKRAVDLAPHDTNALNRLGDLLVRVSRIPEAIDVYQRIADHFGEDGFFLKAIAIYKKVNRLDPRRTETYERLANLYFKQGLVVEGRQQLLTLADWFLRSKQPDEAMRVYRRLVELEPSNFQARAKLVDLSVQQGNVAVAGEEIDALGRTLLSRNMLEEAVKLYHRALELNPEQGDFVAPCVDALVAAGRQAQAAELARKAIAATKAGLELRYSAARAFFESGDVEAARRLLEELLPQSGGRPDVAQLYTEVLSEAGEAVEAKGVLLPTIDRLVQANDLDRAATLVEQLLKSDPRDAEVLDRALKVFDKLNDADMVLNIETALADVLFRASRRQEAADLYVRLVQKVPTNPVFAQRLKELGVTVPAPQPPPSPAPAPGTEPEEALDLVEIDLSHAETGPAAASPAGVPVTAGPTLVPSNTEELFTEAQVFAKYGLTDKAVAHLERLLSLDAQHEQARELLVSLGGGAIIGEVELGRAVASPTAPPLSAPPSLTAREADGARQALTAFAETGTPAPAPPRRPTSDLSLPVPGISLGEVAGRASHPGGGAPLPSFDGLGAPEPPATRTGDARRAPTGAVRLDKLEAMLGLPGSRRGSRNATVEAGRGRGVEAGRGCELVEVPGVGRGGPARSWTDPARLLTTRPSCSRRLREMFRPSDVTSRQALSRRAGTRSAASPRRQAGGRPTKEEEQFFDLAAELEGTAEEEWWPRPLASQRRPIEQLFKEFRAGWRSRSMRKTTTLTSTPPRLPRVGCWTGHRRFRYPPSPRVPRRAPTIGAASSRRT